MRGAALALSLVLLCACHPRLTSFPTSSAPHEQLHDDPARDAQLTLLREAHRAFVQERYPTAALFFRRYVDSATLMTPGLAEARWWLGRSYEQLGEYRAAIAEYRILATSDSRSDPSVQLYQGHALQRLDQLRQIPGGSPATVRRQVALEIPPSSFPPVSVWVPWMQALLKAGVTTVLLDPAVFDEGNDGSPESVQAFVGAAHLASLSVWGSLDPHQGRGIPLRPEWLSQSLARTGAGINGRDASMARVGLPDPMHPDYQAVIEKRARLLLRAGCDGLVLRARETPGYAQDFSERSFQRFTSLFGLTISPSQLWGESEGTAERAQDREADYWRWVGWKARSYVALAGRIRTLIRDANPAGRLLVEVHSRTMSEPLMGLEQYGEDVNDLFQRSGSELVVRLEDSKNSSPVEQLAQQVGSSDRLWLVRTVSVPEKASLIEWTEGIGLAFREQRVGNLVLLPRDTGSLP